MFLLDFLPILFQKEKLLISSFFSPMELSDLFSPTIFININYERSSSYHHALSILFRPSKKKGQVLPLPLSHGSKLFQASPITTYFHRKISLCYLLHIEMKTKSWKVFDLSVAFPKTRDPPFGQKAGCL